MLKEKLIDICSSDLNEKELIKAVEAAITETLPFDHTVSNTYEATSVEKENLRKVGTLDKCDFSTLSEQVERIESMFSKREIGFLFTQVNQIMQSLMSDPLGAEVFDSVFKKIKSPK